MHSGFHWTLIRPAASASEVTTVWRYRNSILFIIIIIIIIKGPQRHRWLPSQRSEWSGRSRQDTYVHTVNSEYTSWTCLRQRRAYTYELIVREHLVCP